MVESKATTLDKLARITELMPLCSCGRGERVVFSCSVSTCQNYEKQKLYCGLCMDDDPSNHEHKSRTISSFNDNIK
jgi:hypothetical protein